MAAMVTYQEKINSNARSASFGIFHKKIHLFPSKCVYFGPFITTRQWTYIGTFYSSVGFGGVEFQRVPSYSCSLLTSDYVSPLSEIGVAIIFFSVITMIWHTFTFLASLSYFSIRILLQIPAPPKNQTQLSSLTKFSTFADYLGQVESWEGPLAAGQPQRLTADFLHSGDKISPRFFLPWKPQCWTSVFRLCGEIERNVAQQLRHRSSR